MKKIGIAIVALLICLTIVVSGLGMTTSYAATTSSKKLSMKSKVTLQIGRSVTLKVKNAGKQKIAWSTSDRDVASVYDGYVSGGYPGTATITAKVGSQTLTCKVTVKNTADKDGLLFEKPIQKGKGLGKQWKSINLKKAKFVVRKDGRCWVEIYADYNLESMEKDRNVLSFTYQPDDVRTYFGAYKEADLLDLNRDENDNYYISCYSYHDEDYPAYTGDKSYGETLKLNDDIKLNQTQTFVKTGIFQEDTLFPKEQKCKIKYTISSERTIENNKYKVTYNVKYKFLDDPKFVTKDITYDDWGWGFTSPDPVYVVFDYQTGLSLEEKNSLGVKVDGKWKATYYPKQYFKYPKEYGYNEKDCWIRNYKTLSYSFSVTYPKDYKDAVVGIGIVNRVPVFDEKHADNRYWTGKTTPYGRTSYYLRGEKTMSYMRLNE